MTEESIDFFFILASCSLFGYRFFRPKLSLKYTLFRPCTYQKGLRAGIFRAFVEAFTKFVNEFKFK